VVTTEKRALRVLRSALPHVRVRVPSGDERVDAVLELPYGAEIAIELKWAGAGFPRDVERALHDLRGGSAVPAVVAANALSPGGQALLDSQDVSWLTADGAAHLHLGSIIVERDARKTAVSSTRLDDQPRWTPAVAAIAETILAGYVRTRAETLPPTTALASRSGRSLGSVTAALQEFDRAQWTQPPPVRRGPTARRRLLDAGSMLESWASWAAPRNQVVRYHSAQREPAETAQTIQHVFGESAAFGGRFAAALIAPYSSNVRTLRCYVSNDVDGADLDGMLAASGLSQSDESARVEICSAPANIMSAVEDLGGYRIASPPRVYADLLRDGVRGEDEAQHLRDVSMGC
jgi:hypothetical protein